MFESYKLCQNQGHISGQIESNHQLLDEEGSKMDQIIIKHGAFLSFVFIREKRKADNELDLRQPRKKETTFFQ